MNMASSPRKLELMLRLNRSDEKPAGAIDVDATQPLNEVVDELLRLANCRLTSDSTLTPWSKRASAIGQSFVISESALPTVQAAASPRKRILRGTSDEFWDVLAARPSLASNTPGLATSLRRCCRTSTSRASTFCTLTTMRWPRPSRRPERDRSLSSRRITVSVTWRASIQVSSTGQCFAATTRSSTRRQQRASITHCWTGSLSFVTRSRLSNPRSWPLSSSDSPCSGRVRSMAQVFGSGLRRVHGIAQMRDTHTGDDCRVPEDGRCVREVVEQPHSCA